ncbi:MAG: hypothetical protein K1X67_20100 [Fimbriimonadaceae bacterium]|nr:hypothetical protein [Fimbriimonadaceae bacterium]
MKDIIADKRLDRFRVLSGMYEVTLGGEHAAAPMRMVEEHVGMEAGSSRDAQLYLQQEGLLTIQSNGYATLTHDGIKEVEDAFDGRVTEHFPANIVVIANSQDCQVVAGHNNESSQMLVTNSDALEANSYRSGSS